MISIVSSFVHESDLGKWRTISHDGFVVISRKGCAGLADVIRSRHMDIQTPKPVTNTLIRLPWVDMVF
jgi:hypothetical protein